MTVLSCYTFLPDCESSSRSRMVTAPNLDQIWRISAKTSSSLCRLRLAFGAARVMGTPTPIGESIVPDYNGDYEDQVAKNTVFKQVAGDAIADRMEALSLEVRGMSDPQYAGLASTETLNAVAAALKATRRKIDQIFEYEGFATSPACDIVLELFEARSRSAPLSVSALCASINCASSTLIRWMKALEVMHLVAMSSEESDGRPAHIVLTEKGYLKTAQALHLHLHE